MLKGVFKLGEPTDQNLGPVGGPEEARVAWASSVLTSLCEHLQVRTHGSPFLQGILS